jgi:hypothetical protein
MLDPRNTRPYAVPLHRTFQPRRDTEEAKAAFLANIDKGSIALKVVVTAAAAASSAEEVAPLPLRRVLRINKDLGHVAASTFDGHDGSRRSPLFTGA